MANQLINSGMGGYMKKIILDTDIGDDIDDALALVFLLRLKQLDLIGVTTVFKNSKIRARLAKKILRLMNREDIPVFAGYSNGLQTKNDSDWEICQKTNELNNPIYAPENSFEGADGEGAVDFIISNAKKYKNELTLVGIGPFTNIAKAIQKDPEAMRLINRIVIMGGAFFEQFIEWNVLCDPDAAKVLFEFDIPLYCVGTDVTWECTVNEQQLELMMSFADENTIEGYLSKLVKMWTERAKRIPILHDPLAVWVIVNDTDVSFEEVLVKIETNGEHTRGCTVNYDNYCRYLPNRINGKRAFVGKKVNSRSFVDGFLKTTFGNSGKRMEIEQVQVGINDQNLNLALKQ
jgi:purine nucleosidase